MLMGGLGIMSAGVVVLAVLGRRVTLNQRLLVRETLGGEALGSAVRLVRYIICFALGAQLVTFLLLFVRLVFKYPAIEAFWQSLFHSISAFNNAGFTIFPDSHSLSAFQSDPAVLWTIGLSILLGAMSYPVMNELARRKGFSRWTLDTRLVVLGTLGLWATGADHTVLLFEVTNPLTLGGMSLGDKISNGAFQAFTSRTAGFSSVDFGHVEAGTSYLYMMMMFVAGRPGRWRGASRSTRRWSSSWRPSRRCEGDPTSSLRGARSRTPK